MSRVVVDASVAAKWFLPAADEPLSDEAFHLFRQYARDEIQLAVPDLFWAELGNLLWKAVRRKRCSRAEAEEALASLQKCALPTIPSQALIEAAFRIAATFDQTVYDALYVALALQSNAQLVTADERLANALAAHLPVKWLGAF